MVFERNDRKPYKFIWVLNIMVENPMNLYGFRSSRSFLYQAMCHERSGDIEAAIAALTRAYELDPEGQRQTS